jgi:putative Ca2+/H+ antiporter (TMEM165/GDT1 family)
MMSLLTVAITIFLAELGDKTQIATVLFASDENQNPWLVFIASSLALTTASAIAVLLGRTAERLLSALPLNLIAGTGFVLIGSIMIVTHLRQTT